MVVTNDIHLPTEAELTVPEVNLSGPALRAGAFHMGKYCEYQNNVRPQMGLMSMDQEPRYRRL